MKNPFFSIIIPVYNVEYNLKECVDSVLVQNFDNYEILLVDDGSTDNSLVICNAYAKQDRRIKVIHKKNRGAASARNCGLLNAKGEYICFLDSDDYWNSKDVLKIVYNKILENAYDIFIIKTIKFYQKSGYFEKVEGLKEKDFQNTNYEERLQKLIAEQLYGACAWNKIFKRELMERGNLLFQEGIVAEDFDWAARLCLIAKTITIVDDPVHVYRKQRDGAVTNSIHLKNLIDTKKGIIDCLKNPLLNERSEKFKQLYYNYVAYRYMIWMAEYAVVKDERKKKLLSEMKSLKWLLNYDDNKKIKMVKVMTKIVGFKLTSKFLGIYLLKKCEVKLRWRH